MNAFRIIFADPQYNYVTSMNATLDEARAYFVGQPLNFGDTPSHPRDNVQLPISVEQVAGDDVA